MRLRHLLSAALALGAAAGYGCGDVSTIRNSKAHKLLDVRGSIEDALATATATLKELEYTVVESKPKPKVTGRKALGNAEIATIAISFREAYGDVTATVDATSTLGADAALDEFVTSYGKRAQVR